MEFRLNVGDRSWLIERLRCLLRAIDDDHRFNELERRKASIDSLHRLGAKELSPATYRDDPYFQFLVGKGPYRKGNIRFHAERYPAFSPFLCQEERSRKDDPFQVERPIGYFREDFCYPSLQENGTTWMSLCPHEIETMKTAISGLSGDVEILGLGLGYVPFSLARKKDVRTIEVVEINEDVISFFEKQVLPGIAGKEKIKIVHGDAIARLRTIDLTGKMVFADLWHDSEDGLPLYAELLKTLEGKAATTLYWLEHTILLYARLSLAILVEEELITSRSDAEYEGSASLSNVLVNGFHFLLKGREFKSFAELKELFGDESLKNLLKQIELP